MLEIIIAYHLTMQALINSVLYKRRDQVVDKRSNMIQ